ncbi:MAG: hypothetical protein ABW252_20145 [Polyangiales bacterium]
MTSPIDDEILQRYHDGDLSPAEARGLSAQIAGDPAAQRRLRELSLLQSLIREAADDASAELDSDALFRAIEGRLPQRAAPSLPPPAPANVRPLRRRGLWLPVLGATAVAAATLLVVLRSGEHDGGAGEAMPPQIAGKLEALSERSADDARLGTDGPPNRWPSFGGELVLVSTAKGSRLEHVDFGRNTGTAFLIEDEDVGVTVVWLDDEDAP